MSLAAGPGNQSWCPLQVGEAGPGASDGPLVGGSVFQGLCLRALGILKLMSDSLVGETGSWALWWSGQGPLGPSMLVHGPVSLPG